MNISVIIPCCNGEAFLAATLESVLNQTLPPAEVIVVDDGSTDGSLALASTFGGIVRTMAQPRSGASAARNAGMAAAIGDAVMFLDADDLLGPTVLEELAAVLAAHPDAVACCPWYRLEEVDGCWLPKPASCAPRRAGQDDLAAWLTGWYHPPCSVLWSRAAYARSGGWDPEVRVNTDGDIMMRGLVAGNTLVAAQGCAAYYRRLPGGMTSLSGRRFSRAGIESRMRVIGGIARRLEAHGRLFCYRAPLAEAYRNIAGNCRDLCPDLHRQCREAERRYAGAPWVRLGSGVSARLGGLQPRATQPSGSAAARAPAAVPAGQGGQPLVSVIIPTYNRAHLLDRTLASVLDQSYRHFELLVVDDGSQDDTAGLVTGHADPRIRYLRQTQNLGAGAARNRGIREARGEFIAFLDSDDNWFPDKLAQQLAVFARLPRRVGLVYGGVEAVLECGGRRIDVPTHRGNLLKAMLVRNVIHGGGSNAMIRRSVVATVGGFDEQLLALEDYDFFMRIVQFYEVDFVAAPVCRYYDTAHAAGPLEEQRRSRNFLANQAARRLFHERYGHLMRHAGVEHLFLMDSARRHLDLPDGDATAAARLIARAMLSRPGRYRNYPWLPFALLPAPVRQVVRPAVRGLRARFRTAA